MKYPKSEPTIDGRAITGARTLRDPRSREYAIQTMFSLKRFLDSKTFSAKHAEGELEEIKTYKHWEVCGFKSLDAYLKAELGVNQRQLRARLAQDLAADPNVPPAAAHGGDRSQQVADSHLNTMSSDSAERIVRRLKRDRPDIAKALARGEFPSARAAAIKAGFIKKLSPLDQIRRLLPKLTSEERSIVHELTADFPEQLEEAISPVQCNEFKFVQERSNTMTKRTSERIALQRHAGGISLTIPLTKADYDANGNPTEEALERITSQVLSRLSEAERCKLAEAGLQDIVEQVMNAMVAEGEAERFTDEAGETRYRKRHAS